jgi:hypothetical protein
VAAVSPLVHGVSTRKVDDLVTALGIDAGVSKSQVSRICAELDGAVSEFREPLECLGDRQVPQRTRTRSGARVDPVPASTPRAGVNH